ncbi:glycosyltransferase family 2 protein [Bacteriovoracaceae bacterium]|nr:glycosyltransferase family 2 protein [Bacteriovoracaceae bacterium]
MKLSILIPVYNEFDHLEQVFDLLFKTDYGIEVEWIVVDDHSNDGSFDKLQSLQSKFKFNLFRQEVNLGKGAAIIRAIKEASGDFILIQDADFEYDPLDIKSLVTPIKEGRADVVYGSRFKKNAMQVHRTYHYFVNRFLTILSNLFSGIYLTDMETCYKVFRSDLLKSFNLTSQRFGIEVELTAYLAKTRARVFELPINYFPRTTLQGKKINWKDGFAALFHLVKFNFLSNENEIFKTSLPKKYKANAHELMLSKLSNENSEK